MSDTVHTEQYEGMTIKIVIDQDAANPFKEWDGEPDIIGWHRRYDFNTRKDDGNKSLETFQEEAKANGYVIMPLFMYDHGNLAFSTTQYGCKWDSGQLGYVFYTKEKRQQAGLTDEYITSILHEGETIESWLQTQLNNSVELLTDYANGNVYGFEIEDSEGETVESCYGFYGDYEKEGGCLEEARSIAKHAAKSARDKAVQQVIDLGKTLGVHA